MVLDFSGKLLAVQHRLDQSIPLIGEFEVEEGNLPGQQVQKDFVSCPDGQVLHLVLIDRKTDELWTEGTMEYGGEISYQGRPGERYQVEVLFFAENEAGYDSRRQTWEVTAE